MKDKRTMKANLKNGNIFIGPWCTIPSSSTINIIAASEMDFVIIDMEHGPHTFTLSEDLIRASESENCTPIVRVSKNDEALILQALDIGAHGVIIPHISSRKDAELAISYAKYHPLGDRGFSPFTRAGGYSPEDVSIHNKIQNDSTMVILVLEGKDGIENLDDILSIENIQEKIDVIYIGAYDLSQAIGFPGQVDHPDVRKTLASCIAKINESGISAGGYVAKNKEDMKWMKEMGMQFITLLPDCTVIYNAFNAFVKEFQEL